MTVTEISPSPDRRGRYRVCFSGGETMKLSPALIADHGLYTGRELDERETEALLRDVKRAEAKQRAVNIISATNVTGRELSDRLRRRGASDADADEAVQWLTELNLLDDARTARQIVERGIRRGYGERRIRQMLYEKKVPREHWEDALSALPAPEAPIDDYLRANLTDAEDPKQRKRAADALIRRGFDWNDIKSGLRRFGSEADALEDA